MNHIKYVLYANESTACNFACSSGGVFEKSWYGIKYRGNKKIRSTQINQMSAPVLWKWNSLIV